MKNLFVLPLLLSLICTPVFADVIDPSEDVCSGANEGDACGDPGQGVAEGTCQAAECSRLDYSNGTPPETVSYDCLICKSDASSSGPAPEAGSEMEETMNATAGADSSTDEGDTDEAESVIQRTSPSIFDVVVAFLGLLLSIRLYRAREE